MIAGLILNHIGQSQYSVQLSYDVSKADALIAWNEQTAINKQGELTAHEQLSKDMSDENITLTALVDDSRVELSALKLKPVYPGDDYDFKDFALIDSLTANISNLESQINNLLNSLNSLNISLQNEREKPIDDNGNPDCLAEFYCKQTEQDLIDQINVKNNELNAKKEDLELNKKQLNEENRKLPALADAEVGFYRDTERFNSLSETIRVSKQKIASNKEKLINIKIVINALKIELLSIQKKIDWLQTHKGVDQTIFPYSNEYDESLTGVAAIELIGGNIEMPVIIKNAVVDGLLSKTVNITKEHSFINFALMPGWLKWSQTHGIGVAQSVGASIRSGITGLNNKLSLVKNVKPYNLEAIDKYSEYRYEVGDSVLVEYSSNGLVDYKGWYERPRMKNYAVTLIGSETLQQYYVVVIKTAVIHGPYANEAAAVAALNLEYFATQEQYDQYISAVVIENTLGTAFGAATNNELSSNIEIDTWQDGVYSHLTTISYNPLPTTDTAIDYVSNFNFFNYYLKNPFYFASVFKHWGAVDNPSYTQDFIIINTSDLSTIQLFSGLQANVLTEKQLIMPI